MLSVKQGGIKYHFWVFDMTRPAIELQSPEPLANSLLISPVVWSNQILLIHQIFPKNIILGFFLSIFSEIF